MASGGSPGRSGGTGWRRAVRASTTRDAADDPSDPVSARPRTCSQQRHPGKDDRAPTTWIPRIGSSRKIAAIPTASTGTRNWRPLTRVGPSSFTPWKMTTLANPAASVPEYRIASRTGSPNPDRSDVTSWAIPSGAMNRVPATIAQVVVTSGEWRRRMVAPNTV